MCSIPSSVEGITQFGLRGLIWNKANEQMELDRRRMFHDFSEILGACS
jgi:hypothetical protein